jgi:hypothetical protein
MIVESTTPASVEEKPVLRKGTSPQKKRAKKR